MVDGVLYSCDFSEKSRDKDSPYSNGYFSVNGVSTPLHRQTMVHQAVRKLQAARKALGSKNEAKRAVERAIRMAIPVKDDLSLAEEMSKCEGLMTRTGLKRVAAESAGSSLPLNTTAPPGSSTLLSIPLSKTKKMEAASSPPRKTAVSSSTATSKPSVKTEELPKYPSHHSNQVDKPISLSSHHHSQTSVTSMDLDLSDAPAVATSCDCRSSLSMVGSNGKGWEGTATLTHGSRLRFGCLQFILSLTGQPGHSELIQALSYIHESQL